MLQIYKSSVLIQDIGKILGPEVNVFCAEYNASTFIKCCQYIISSIHIELKSTRKNLWNNMLKLKGQYLLKSPQGRIDNSVKYFMPWCRIIVFAVLSAMRKNSCGDPPGFLHMSFRRLPWF